MESVRGDGDLDERVRGAYLVIEARFERSSLRLGVDDTRTVTRRCPSTGS